MSADVGQQKNETLPGDACDVGQIQDEDLLRKMWQTTEDFGRKKEIRARMYKLREQRLREFYTTGEVLKDVQSVDPATTTVSSTTTASSSTSIREETPKRCGTHYRQLVVGELRGGVENTTYETTSNTTSSGSSSTMQVRRSEERTNGGTVEVIETRTSTSSKLPRLNMSRNSEITSEQSTQQTERQVSNTDTKIMSELQKLDTFLSATGVDSPTPTPEKGSTFDTTNWTVVSTNNQLASDVKLNNARVEEFVFESGEGDEPRTKTVISEYHAPGSEKSPEVHAVVRQSETKWSGETADGATVTRTSKSSSSYSTSMQTQQHRISTDLSKDHEAFARSLRSSPERRMYESSTSTRSSSKNSLDASVGRRSPERPFNTRSPTRSPRPSDNQSPRASPDKEQRCSPSRLNRMSPTRTYSDQNRASPSRDVVDRTSHMKRNPDKITTRPSPERQVPVNRTSPTRDVRKTSQSSPTREVHTRRTSQTSPTRETTVLITSAKDRESPARRTSQSSPARDSPTRKASRTSPTRESPTRTFSTQSRASPDKERSISPDKSTSPSRVSCTTTRVTSTSSSNTATKERRKLSSASSRAATKRLGTPGASPTTSPTRDSKRDKPDEPPSGTEDENVSEVFLDDEKPPTELLAPSDDETESKKSTLSTSTLTTTLKTSSMSEISNKKSTVGKDVHDISGSGTLPRKKSNLKQPTIHSAPDVKANSLIEISKTEKDIYETNVFVNKATIMEKSVTPTPQSMFESSPDISTPQSSPESKSMTTSSLIETTAKKATEIDSSTLPRKKSSLIKEPVAPQTTPQSSSTPQSSPESKSMTTSSLIETTAKKVTEIDSSTLPRKKSSLIKEPVAPQTTPQSSSTPQSSPESKSMTTSSLIEITAKKVTEIDSSTLPRKKSSLIKEPVAQQTTPQSSPSPDVETNRPNKLTSVFREFPPEQKKAPTSSPVDKHRSIFGREESPKPCQPTPKSSPLVDNKPTEPDDSSRSLTNGSLASAKTSEVEDMLENAPCEAISAENANQASPEPLKKSSSHDRHGRRRSREYVSDDDTSGRESSSSPVRKQPTRTQQSKSPLKSKIPAASPQRPTKLPVAAVKYTEPVALSPDRCCGRAHDSDKPWRQSPVSPKKKSPASPVTIQERKPVTSTPIRRRIASRSPSTSPDRPHEPQSRPGRKSPPQKTVQSPRSPPAKQTTSASPMRTPDNKRPITERTPSGGRLRNIPEPQRPSGIAKPQTRGATSPTKPASPLGRKKPESVSKPRAVNDERPPQEFHADETSEDDSCIRRHGTSRIATSTARRVDVVRKVQGVQPVSTRPTSRLTQPQPALKSPASRLEPQRPSTTSRVPTATHKRPTEVAKPRPVRTDSDKSIGSTKKTPTKLTVTNTTKLEQKTIVGKKQVAQSCVRESTTTVSRLPAAKVKLTVQRATPASRVPVKPKENGKAPIESEDEESCTFSTEEDETVTELEEVRYSSHTVDTEDEDFKARVNARGASLKPATTDIVLLRSSRESSPEAQRRYADHVSEPDTDTDLQKREREITPLNVVVKPEQVTDLDETDEPDPSLLSVADRVSRFLTPSTTTVSPPEKKKPVIIETASPCLDSPSAVRRARAMFETIANSPSEPAPRQTVPDILSRPSVFESPNRGRSPAVPLPVKKPIREEYDETDEPNEFEPKQPVEDRFATITRDVKKLDENRFNTITKDIKKIDTSVTETRINKETSSIDEDSKFRTITKERSVEPIETTISDDESNTFVSTAILGTKQEQDQLITTRRDSIDQKSTRRDSADQKITTRRDSDQKITTRRDSDQKITTRRDSDQKITTRRDSDQRITTRRDSDQKITTRRDSDHKFTRRDSDQKITEKARAAVAPRQESPSGTRDVAGKRVEPSKQPTGGKFGVTLRQTSSSRIDTSATGRQVTEQKKTTTTTTVFEGVVIEQITDLKILEQMLEKATDYDLRRRLRAQIREVRRLGPSHFTPTPAAGKEPRKSSPTRQTPATEEPERRPSSSSSPTRRPSDVSRQSPTRVPDTSRQSPTRRPSEVSRQSPTRVPDTSRQSPTRRPSDVSRESPTRVPDTSRQSPTRRPSDVSRQSPTRVPEATHQSPTRVPDTSRQSPVRQSPERRVSSVRDPDSRSTSPTKEPTRKSSSTPRDEEDGNRMSSTFIRQASKKFEQDQSRDESKFATFTRQSSSKKVVDETKQQEDTRFSTFTRSSSNKKLPEPSKESPPTERKSSKSELTIELAKPGSPATGSKHSSTTRKPSVPSAASAPREVNPTDSITSSYGVGPTDESGRPLFGLRALRRSQQQEPGSVVIDQQPAVDTPDTEVRDSSGRPLFGLRALKKEDSSRSPDKSSPQSPATDHVMPERAPSSGQLRDLVQRHEQRTSTGSAASSPQKPRAKLRDSFITQEIRGSVTRTSKEEALTSRSAERSNALRAIIQKHETITDSEQNKLVRKDSSRIESKQTTQSIHENGVERSSPAPRTEREESPKLAADPIRRPSTEGSPPTEQTRRPGILKKPRDSPERSTTTTTSSTAVSTATINLRKVDEASVNKIIEDTRRSSITRSPPDGSTSNTFELESPRAVAEITQRALDKEKDYDEEQIITDEDGGETRIRRTHKEEKDELGSRSFTRTAAVSKRSEPGREERYSSAVTTVTQQRSTTGTPPSPGKPEHSIARVGRSGSVKALQQRFQQAAAGTGATDAKVQRGAGYQKAGLIFRTNSFQHTNGCGPDLPAGTRSKEGSPSPVGKRDSESDVAEDRQTSSTSRSTVTVSKSFLGNETRVTGVQDILTRMREADHEEVTPGTSEDDREARALLNKFLGAQVLLQGMEPLIAAQSPALVSQVERQRIVVSSSTAKDDVKSSAEEDELERIWDEKRLRQLLEASDDYDSRRKIRARLRVVMAENKVTAPTGSDVRECETTQVQQSSSSSSATGADSGVLSTVRGELLPYIVEQLKTSLERGGSTAAAPVPGCSVAAPSTISSSSNGGGGSSESSEDGPAFDSGTESGEDPRTPSSQTETQDELLPDGSEFNCFMEGLRNSFDSRQGFADTVEESDKIAELPPDVIKDVHAALAKLRGSLQLAAIRGEIVDPERSEALLSLITRLQSSLQKQEQPPPLTIPPPWQDTSSSLGSPPVPAPRKKKSAGAGRHTVGVSREELDDARKHLDEQVSLSSPVTSPNSTPSPGINNSGSTPSFRPVHFSPMRSPSLSTFFNSSAKPFSQQGKPQPAPRPLLPLSLPKKVSDEPPHPSVGVTTSSSSDLSVGSPKISDEIIQAHEPVVALTKQRPRAASWTDDPSKLLFTPAQSVQIAVHKAAINKQLSLDERRSEIKPADSILLQNLKEKSPIMQQYPAPVVHDNFSAAPSNNAQQTVSNSIPNIMPSVTDEANMPSQPTPRTNMPKQNLAGPHIENNAAPPNVLPKPSGKPLISMPITKSSHVQPILQRNKPDNLTILVSSSDSIASNQSLNSPKISSQQSSVPSSPNTSKLTQANIHENPTAPPRTKPVIKDSPLSPDKAKLNLNFLENQASVVPSTVIWGSILNSSGKPGDEEMCSAQKLLQIATTKVDDLSPTSSRSSRSERRKKMKRANTIDIPKPLHMIDLEDSEDDDESGNESDITPTDSKNKLLHGVKVQVPAPAPFVPKTENDRKFLAFLERRSPVETKPAYRPLITGSGGVGSGNHWNSRFSNLKTNFESKQDGKSLTSPTQKTMDLGLSARKFWSKADDEVSGKSQKTGPRLSRQTSSNLKKMFEERDALQKRNGSASAGPKLENAGARPPWAVDQKPIVVVGSLTVSGKGQQLPASTVQTRRQVYTAPTAQLVPHPPPKIQPPKVPPSKMLPPPTPPTQPMIQISQIEKLEELQRQQQLQFLQQKQQQEEYRKSQAQKQKELLQKQKSLSQHSSPVPAKETIRGPAPISKFSHALNSAFRPIEKRSNSLSNAVPSEMMSVGLVRAQQGAMRRLSTDDDTSRSPSSPPVLSRQNSEDAPVMMTAVSRVMAAPVSQQATVTSQVKRRDTDFEAPRSSAAKNLSNMLQRFSEADDGDLDPELCMSPPESRRNYGLAHSSHSTSDMHDPTFQERFSSQRTQNNLSVASSSNSSIGRYESAISSSSPINFTNTRNGGEDQVITMRLEIPLVQNTATPSPTFYPTQYYQAQFQNPPPTLLSPPVQRRNNSISSTQSFEAPKPKRDLSPKEAAGFAPLRKCESWHQLAYQKQRPQSLALPSVTPPTRRSPNTKAHLFSKQYEARMSPESVEDKQRRVEAYFQQELQQHTKLTTTKTTSKKLVTEVKRSEAIAPAKRPEYSRQDTLRHFLNEDDLANVDEEFENLFNDSVRTKKPTSAAPPKPHLLPTGFGSSQVRRPHQQSGVSTSESDDCASLLHIPPATLSLTAGASKHSESSVVNSSTSDATTRTEVHTKTSSFSSSMTSKTRVSKATPPSKLQMSPFAKFKQLDEQNSSPSPSSPKTPGGSGSVPLFKFTDAGLNRSASTVKDKLLYWCQIKTKEYKDLKIENFSTSWSNGLAFCALIHHFCPDAFDYAALRPEYRRKNFELAFRVAEEKFDIAPLLDVDDMVMMKKPDWKCVFTYVQSIYRRFKDELD